MNRQTRLLFLFTVLFLVLGEYNEECDWVSVKESYEINFTWRILYIIIRAYNCVLSIRVSAS